MEANIWIVAHTHDDVTYPYDDVTHIQLRQLSCDNETLDDVTYTYDDVTHIHRWYSYGSKQMDLGPP